MDRYLCPGCKQELSRSTFYRHKNLSVCPGKAKSSSIPQVAVTEKALPNNNILSSGESEDVTYNDEMHIVMSGNESENSTSLEEDFIDYSDITEIEIIDHEILENNAYEDNDSDLQSKNSASASITDSSNIPESTSEENCGELQDKLASGTPPAENEVSRNLNPVIKVMSHYLLFFQLKFKVPDRAIHFILVFLKGLLLMLLSLIPNNDILTQLHKLFPFTLYGLKKNSLSVMWKKSITEYITCVKCSTLTKVTDYNLSVRTNLHNDIPKCSFIEFPNHPQKARRKKCNFPLFKQVKYGSKYKLVPCKSFLFNSIIETLKSILNRPGIIEMCDHWRNCRTTDGELSDVYDGRLWRKYLFLNGAPFLDVPYNIALALNIDWFNPYVHTQYSIGAIYFTILNLPRSHRYKIENTIIAGLIPGPNEPKSINTFLQPIVDELTQLWQGVDILVSRHFGVQTVKAALFCFVSDLPATRKVCGFPSFNAKLGCSKCLKEFKCEQFSGPTDYSGYDRQNWKPRMLTDHNDAVKRVKASVTLTEQKQLQKEYGVHYSELSKLSYFDVITSHIIDPMHNLYLGTAKNMLKTWKECGIIREEHLQIIQQRVDELNVPHGIGRIPYKIGSNFSGLTADQWLNWTNMYSLYALRSILPPAHIQCWSLFVQASVVLRQYTLTERDLEMADESMLAFCQAFERLYGKEKCTPNMHLHNHIKECVLDYGPISAFWTFPFERFNGLLESFSKNWMKPEEQILQKVINFQELLTIKSISPEFSSLNELCLLDHSVTGSFQHTQMETKSLKQYKSNTTCPTECINAELLDIHHIAAKSTENYFTDDELDDLKKVYSLLYPDNNYCILHVNKRHTVFHDVEIFGETFMSSRSRSQ